MIQRFTPASDREASAIVREAAETSQALEIVSAGTKGALGRPVVPDALLDMSQVAGVIDYRPEELVFTAKTATPLKEIEAMLAAHDQMLGFEPPDWAPRFGGNTGRQTLAGVVAADVCGPRRVKHGSVRDHVIGCRFINGSGELIRAGGPVIKNVTGFDIPKLMCGAFGTLGVLTELTLRVLPRPQSSATLVLRDCAPGAGLSALITAAQLPVEASGLGYLPRDALRQINSEQNPSPGWAVIRVDGTMAAVSEKLDVLKRQFGTHDCTILDSLETDQLFGRIGDGSVLGSEGDLWRLCVPPASAATAIARADTALWYADWGGALLWMQMPATTQSAETLRAITGGISGHATLFRASANARSNISVFEPESPVRGNLTQALKQAFDPGNILNPQRMFSYL